MADPSPTRARKLVSAYQRQQQQRRQQIDIAPQLQAAASRQELARAAAEGLTPQQVEQLRNPQGGDPQGEGPQSESPQGGESLAAAARAAEASGGTTGAPEAVPSVTPDQQDNARRMWAADASYAPGEGGLPKDIDPQWAEYDLFGNPLRTINNVPAGGHIYRAGIKHLGMDPGAARWLEKGTVGVGVAGVGLLTAMAAADALNRPAVVIQQGG